MGQRAAPATVENRRRLATGKDPTSAGFVGFVELGRDPAQTDGDCEGEAKRSDLSQCAAHAWLGRAALGGSEHAGRRVREQQDALRVQLGAVPNDAKGRDEGTDLKHGDVLRPTPGG